MAKLLDLKKARASQTQKTPVQIEEISKKDIAIIGIACKFPDANNPEEFWMNLSQGQDSIRPFPKSRRFDTDSFLQKIGMSEDQIQYNEGGYLDEIDRFDAPFFKMSPTEARLMDPNQRLFLEMAWKALEDAGYGGKKGKSKRTGVYVGFSSDFSIEYKRLVSELEPANTSLSIPGNIKSIIASRIAYLLDFRGPSMMVDTACSSVLTAVHLASRALRQGECEMALAGGVKISILPMKSEVGIGIKSSDYRAKTFDDRSDGTGFGEGVGVVVLKPLHRALKDKDHIYAVIKGSAVNQDGSSVGITAPNALAQADVVTRAWKDAGIDPETITYIEAHGTGTKLGDPIEIDGITKAFQDYTQKKQFCGISSVKTNIGHLDNAAGIAGLIKLILALQHKELPPTVHFERPNRRINFENSPVYLIDHLEKWETNGVPGVVELVPLV